VLSVQNIHKIVLLCGLTGISALLRLNPSRRPERMVPKEKPDLCGEAPIQR